MSVRIHARRATFVRAAAWAVIFGAQCLIPSLATGQPATQTAIIDETSTPVSFTGAWMRENSQRSWTGGTAALATTAAASVTVRFSGTGVKWIGFRGPQAGIARVFLDGSLVATVDTFASTEEIRAAVFSAGTLGDTSHTLTVEVTGDKHSLSSGNVVVVDAFEITAGPAGFLDTTPPIIAMTSPKADATVPTGIIIRAIASDDVAVAGIRFLVDGAEIGVELLTAPYSIAWDTSTFAEGPHTLAAVARDAAGNISSTTVSVVVDRTPPTVTLAPGLSSARVAGTVTIAASASDDVGVDRVWFSVDGVLLGEDTTPPYEKRWDTVAEMDGSHTLKAVVRDNAGGLNSTVANVSVSNGARVEETSATITYSGTWSLGNQGVRAWSGGTAAIATLTAFPARATVRFDGRGVKWIGFRGPQAGIANVYLDGEHVATVDLFVPAEQVRSVVFEMTGLAAGSHTLTIEATGKWNSLSTDPFVVVDAFIVSD